MAKSALNRHNSFKKAIRKKKIADAVCWTDFYDNLHQYSKNKIHCSCGMCRRKTNNKGKARLIHGNYAPSKNWKPSDRKKMESMNEQEKEI